MKRWYTPNFCLLPNKSCRQVEPPLPPNSIGSLLINEHWIFLFFLVKLTMHAMPLSFAFNVHYIKCFNINGMSAVLLK